MVNSFDQAIITNSMIINSVGYGMVIDSDAVVNGDVETSNNFSDNTLGTVFFEM